MPQSALFPSHARRSRSLLEKSRLTKELHKNKTVTNVPLTEDCRIKKQERLAEIEELLKVPLKERVSRGLAEG